MVTKILDFAEYRICQKNKSNKGKVDITLVPPCLNKKACELSKRYKVADFMV